MLVFDTETRIDATQRLTFGSYRFLVDGRCQEEGLFYGDDLPDAERRMLARYVATHRAEVVDEGRADLLLLTRRQFLKKFYEAGYKGRALIVGFNLPFDLSRLAIDVGAARERFAGGFSLTFWSYTDTRGSERPNRYRPRIGIKHIDSKRALIGFTARHRPDPLDLVSPPHRADGGAPHDRIFRGHFLDLRRLAFALTDRGYSLASACEAFGVAQGKQTVTRHGVVTRRYIDYNRRDVSATADLAAKLLEEYARHPIGLQVTKAYSPASIGKAYLRTMGITPVLERQPDFPTAILGYAQSAFFGGRTSAHIRHVTVPVICTDFLSMYPTVNSLMGLWRFVTAKRIAVDRHCRTDVLRFLRSVTADRLFRPGTWPRLTAFVRIIPNGDLLPSRSQYSEGQDWQVALNHLYGERKGRQHALWFALPDVVASVLLTGRIPTILDAFRLRPRGTLAGLTSTRLRGVVDIDPRRQDFFRIAIEERKRLATRRGVASVERQRLDKALKVLANATSYGIYAEMQRQEFDDPVDVRCHGLDARPFTCRVAHADVPGEYCFPPLASLITAAARLMLALLEHCVVTKGGTYAMEDTDSMAIVATKRGGLIPCAGGSSRTRDGKPAVTALSWRQVQQIATQFRALHPYDRRAVPGSILKIEDDNVDPRTEKQRQIYCLAISAKRYALFVMKHGQPTLLREDVNNQQDRWSEHGLGHLLNPTDPDRDDRDWIARAWLTMIRRALGLRTRPGTVEHLPAVGRVTVSSPAVLRPFARLNARKAYPRRVKPFNFLVTCHVKPLGHPPGIDTTRFHLMGPYESDPVRWLKMEWINQYTGLPYHITTTGEHGHRRAARVKTYGDVLVEYAQHPEAKCADMNAHACGKRSVGLLQRRKVRIAAVKYIGKESNNLEEVEAGLVHSEQSIYTEYRDPRRDEWRTTIVPALKRIPLKQFERLTGKSRRMLIDARKGRRRPHRRHQELLTSVARKLGIL